ncbi:hypothetical protein TCAL_12213 [Tigriopus californicus]|uniref:Hyccin n=1 Tax=Tigriopus californicus TaxID=6832 RepID=A0A553NSG3_TIGCA|nr:uncharacterized protein LOC131886936 [Tigriopus californicus]TRY68374.1 hypothetical protein TCAL_12213 [Tigriopus californicus]|eukprot:TCALIF_12213-PA protein Name:"Similar to FAM126A Hyccin (Homo sapiens)" AED:0.05 eAED:0.07 QI:0/-1/0/1/-1/1/1/0/526
MDVDTVLTDFEGSQPDELITFFSTLANNVEMQNALFSAVNDERILESGQSQLLTRLLTLLLAWHRTSGSPGAPVEKHAPVCWQYVPPLVALYLIARQSVSLRAQAGRTIEASLLTLYHAELIDRAGEPTTSNVQIGSLAQSSLYHDGARVEHASENLPAGVPGGLTFKLPIHPALGSRVTALSRWLLIEGLYRVFNGVLADLSKVGVEQFARNTLRLLQRGGGNPVAAAKDKGVVRVILNGPVLQEMLYGAYFCIYNGFQTLGTQMVEAIRQRGCAMASPELLLTVNAIRTLVLTSGPSQLPSATSITTPSQIAKNMITNASFRAKKMGDDIPKVEGDPVHPPDPHTDMAHKLANMTSITEELTEEVIEKKISGQPAPVTGEAAKTPKDKIKAKLSNINTGILNLKRLSESDRDSDHRSSKQLGMELKKMDKQKGGSSLSGSTGAGSAAGGMPSDAASETSSNAGMSKKEKKSAKEKNAPKSSVERSSGNNSEIDSIEQIEALIQKGRVPAETVTIHSPESGTTIF